MFNMVNNKLQEFLNVIFGLIAFLMFVGLAGGLEHDTISCLQWAQNMFITSLSLFAIWYTLGLTNKYITYKIIQLENQTTK